MSTGGDEVEQLAGTSSGGPMRRLCARRSAGMSSGGLRRRDLQLPVVDFRFGLERKTEGSR
jgi:hypothetical protein